jgi:alkyl hydroperoxide reductase subunit AhpC
VNIIDFAVGRSVEELLRLVEALQFSDKYGMVCPAKWKKGDRGVRNL